MKQGEKHMTALAIGSALTLPLVCLALLPMPATAQPAAAHEYELGDLPRAGGDNEAAASGAGTGGDGGDTSQVPAVLPAESGSQGAGSGSDATGTGGSGGGDAGKDGLGAPKGGSGGRAGGPATEATIPAVNASASDDGSAPTLLIVVAAVAAISTGFAAWRLRGSTRSGNAGSGGPGSA